MDAHISKALNDKLYDKRKSGALELEAQVRECLAIGDHDRIERIVHQLCHDFAYAVHQPHARNGGLIGLAAASIALGPEVARYLEEIVPPVLACFTDQDARVRYYACESMYNIAKVAKGEILLFFNDVFDALSKLAADNELSVKNGAELLDRLVKDIVSESAANYVSVLNAPEDPVDESESTMQASIELPTAFSLNRFMPLLQERINVINPYTRTFLVSWITLLDSIPDLELVSYLPDFLAGLFKFLDDANQDVHTQTQAALDKFLVETKKIARVKRGIAESRKSGGEDGLKPSTSSLKSEKSEEAAEDSDLKDKDGEDTSDDGNASSNTPSDVDPEHNSGEIDGSWVPGQDVHVDHPKILGILVSFLSSPSAEEIQVTTLRWIESFFEICPEDILPFVPSLLSHVLPALSNEVEQVRQAANRVNSALMEYIMSLPDDANKTDKATAIAGSSSPSVSGGIDRRDVLASNKSSKATSREHVAESKTANSTAHISMLQPDITPQADTNDLTPSTPATELDYEAAVSALTLQFLHEFEATRVAALAWLIMLHRKAPRKILAINDGTFPALLKTLSDPSDSVVTRDLVLLSQISKNSDDSYFTSFMVNLLKLFCTDRKLLETRGNLIIRQLCVSLSSERIYRVMADCLEKDEDVEFVSIMVQNLNNNLIAAPEMADLRRRLRNLDTRDGQNFFVTLFKPWCHNAVATISLCFLAQAYEQAYNLMQIFGDLEMTIDVLIQIDKLVQLIESPVFTYLRLQLLEPERYPYLYKCLYGLLMLLPQSSAFAALKNRLSSVSAVGYLHMAPRGAPSGSQSTTPTGAAAGVGSSAFDRSNRLKATRDDGSVRWVELLDKFKMTQERARRAQRAQQNGDGEETQPSSGTQRFPSFGEGVEKKLPLLADAHGKAQGRPGSAGSGAVRPPPVAQPTTHQKANQA